MEPVSPVQPVSPGEAPRGIFGTNIPSSACTILAFLLFFLPFAEIRCDGGSNGFSSMMSSQSMTVASNSGMGLAIGQSWKVSMGAFGQEMGLEKQQQLGNRESPNYYALIAWVLALGAVIFSLVKWRWGAQLAMVSAVVSFASMIGLFIDLKNKVKDVPGASNTGSAVDRYTDANLEMSFTLWFYAAALLLLAAAYFSYKRASTQSKI